MQRALGGSGVLGSLGRGLWTPGGSPPTVAAYVASVLAKSPLRYQRLGTGGGADESPHGRDMTVVGSPGTTTGAIVDSDLASTFASGGNYLTRAYDSGLSTSSYTEQFWCRLNSGFSGAHTIAICNGSYDDNKGYYIDVYAGPLTVSHGKTYHNGTTSFVHSTWYYCVVTYASGTLKIYINGRLEYSGSVSFTPNNNRPFRIAGNQERSTSTLYWPGAIDESATYDYALTGAQQNEDYHLGLGSAYGAEVASDDPAWWFRMSESSGNLRDSAVQGLTGTVTGTPTRSVTGIAVSDYTSDYAMTFGGSSYISVPNVANGQEISCECWVKTTSTSQLSIMAQGGSLGELFQMRLESNGKAGWLVEPYPGAYITSTTSIRDGSWHHLVGTCKYTGGTRTTKLYIDGALENTTTDSNSLTTTDPNAVRIGGGNSWTGSNHFVGSIDEPALYLGELSAARVLAHYDAA